MLHVENEEPPEIAIVMFELAAACRVLLRTVGIAERWTDHGPDDQARAWLAAGDRADDCPAELTPDQWTMLRVCWGLWGRGAFAEIFNVPLPALLRLAECLTAFSFDALPQWSLLNQ